MSPAPDARFGAVRAVLNRAMRESDAPEIDAYVSEILAAVDTADPEIREGMRLDGAPGALWRFIRGCDYRRAHSWMRGEMLRGSSQEDVFDVVTTVVASLVLMCAGHFVRTEMRRVARDVMSRAAVLLERDIEALITDKRQTALERSWLRVVDP